MNQDAIGVEFSALTEDEQEKAVGGDGYLAGLIGNGIGVAAGWLVTAIVVGYKASSGREIYYAPGLGYF